MCWNYCPVSFESGSEVYLNVCVLEGEGRVYTRLSLCAEFPVHPTDQTSVLPSGGDLQKKFRLCVLNYH